MLADDHLDRLVADLASADPAVRDDGAFVELAGAVGAGDLSAAQSRRLGGLMVARLTHAEPQARSFAPLVLGVLAEHGVVEPAWVAAVCRWYVTEPDLRGHDAELGWVHAAAHGADCLAAFGRAGAAPPRAFLRTLVERLVAPTAYVFRDQEDDRIAHAAAVLLASESGAGVDDESRPTLVDADWLAPVAGLLADGEPGPVPPQVSNTLRTLRCLSLLLGEQHLVDGEPVVVPGAESVRAAIAAALRTATPWMYA